MYIYILNKATNWLQHLIQMYHSILLQNSHSLHVCHCIQHKVFEWALEGKHALKSRNTDTQHLLPYSR